MKHVVSPVAAHVDLAACAHLMTRTPLWADTGYAFDRCLAYISHPASITFAVLKDGSVAGFATVLEHGMGFEPMLMFLCVDAHWRRQGVATALMECVEKTFPRLYLTVTETNDARNFYLRRGWTRVGALPDHEVPGVTELIMRFVSHSTSADTRHP